MFPLCSFWPFILPQIISSSWSERYGHDGSESALEEYPTLVVVDVLSVEEELDLADLLVGGDALDIVFFDDMVVMMLNIRKIQTGCSECTVRRLDWYRRIVYPKG